VHAMYSVNTQNGKDAARWSGDLASRSFWKIWVTWASTVRSVTNNRAAMHIVASRS
jgi:hypothetical protein